MKTFVTATALAAGASAAVLARNDNGQCCFQLTASGGVSGTLGQLSDGQNRVGGGLGTATYCINNGKITDASGRGCILTAPTTQFQCDKGATPQGGFSVNSNSMLAHNGDTTFYACPADQGEYNIYTVPVKNQPKCVKVELSTGGKCEAQQTSAAGTTVMQTQTQTVTQQCTPSTVYKTEYQTAYKPTTVYKTNEETMYATVYNTKTMEETNYVTKPTTVYETKTMQETVTNQTPTTVYKTKTMEETEYVTKPTTVYETKTVYQTEHNTNTVVNTDTVYNTKTVATTPKAATGTMTAPAAGMTGPAGACPASLMSGSYQYPHLIVPVNSQQPDMSYGTSYNGMMNSTMSSYFNFDVPASYSGKMCELAFMFPKKANLETSGYSFNMMGSVMVEHSDSTCMENDSWNSAPKGSSMGSFSPMPGNSYTVWSGECPAGTTQTYKMSAEGGLDMNYFQDYNPCPLGLYMTMSD